MAVVTITQAAKLVRRGRASLYRDIGKGILSKTISPSGETGVDTSELVRAYGTLYLNETPTGSIETSTANNIEGFSKKADARKQGETSPIEANETSGDTIKVAILEERLKAYEHRIELLERITTLEGNVRRDTVAALKAQLADKDVLIQSLENQVLMLGYNKPTKNTPEKVFNKTWLRRIFRRT